MPSSRFEPWSPTTVRMKSWRSRRLDCSAMNPCYWNLGLESTKLYPINNRSLMRVIFFFECQHLIGGLGPIIIYFHQNCYLISLHNIISSVFVSFSYCGVCYDQELSSWYVIVFERLWFIFNDWLSAESTQNAFQFNNVNLQNECHESSCPTHRGWTFAHHWNFFF